MKLSGLAVDGVNERLMHERIIDFSSVLHGLWNSELDFALKVSHLLIAVMSSWCTVIVGLDAKKSWIIKGMSG